MKAYIELHVFNIIIIYNLILQSCCAALYCEHCTGCMCMCVCVVSHSGEFFFLFSSLPKHRALLRYKSDEIKILKISFFRVGIVPTTCRVYSRTLVPLRHDWPLHNIDGNNMKLKMSIIKDL